MWVIQKGDCIGNGNLSHPHFGWHFLTQSQANHCKITNPSHILLIENKKVYFKLFDNFSFLGHFRVFGAFLEFLNTNLIFIIFTHQHNVYKMYNVILL